MSATPRLVELDPWLAPYTELIQKRLAHFQGTWEQISTDQGDDIATWHERVGIFRDKKSGDWTIREWAPSAQAVSLTGSFNDWDNEATPLKSTDGGFWEATLPADQLAHESLIKLHVTGADGSQRDRIPSTMRRVIQDPETHDFSGQIWEPAQPYQWKNTAPKTPPAPIIYEAHVGMGGEQERVHNFREFADDILPRIAKGGYNTIQFMAIAEHPYYGSFGYHVSSFFAPTSRCGTPEDLKYLIDTAHGLGLTVLMDIVHSHAVKNLAEGLNLFDGTDYQYFHSGDKGEHPQWDSKLFDYAKPEVRDFLLSNVRYWLEEFHFDGFRFDGVTSMLYEHHGLTAFDHYDKYFFDGVDPDAILYLQLASALAHHIRPDATLVAEDMSGMPGLCRPLTEGGLGFTHRLAMGIPDHWIKLLKHQRDEDWNLDTLWNTLSNRRHGEATIAYVESHDQALVGDKTIAFWLMDKEMYFHMSLETDHPVIERGIALHKIIRLITSAVGGEGYLTFIGNEFGHPEWVDFPREGNDWSYQHCRRLWSLADNPELRYQHMGLFDSDLMHFLAEHDILSANPAQLLHCHGGDRVLAFERNNRVFVFNFSVDRAFTDYGISVTADSDHHIVLHSDLTSQGGQDRFDTTLTYPVVDNRVQLYLPPRTALVLAPK